MADLENHVAGAQANQAGPRSSTAALTEAHFKYLDRLRERGVTNMYGAGPYVERRFSVGSDKAREIVIAWMRTFDGKSTPAERIAKATGAA